MTDRPPVRNTTSFDAFMRPVVQRELERYREDVEDQRRRVATAIQNLAVEQELLSTNEAILATLEAGFTATFPEPDLLADSQQ